MSVRGRVYRSLVLILNVMKINTYELLFKCLLQDLKVDFVQEYKFHPSRKFRFDFALVDKKIAFEIDGGLYVSGRHTSPTGYCTDCIKQLLATQLGWRVVKIPTLWFNHHKRKKKQAHLIYYEDLREIIREVVK